MIIISILIFIFILGLLVLVHEWGHFFASRRAGVRVDEFGIGFPPKMLSIQRGGTKYSINLFPIGGFVKIHGEDGEGGKEEPNNFMSKSIPARMFIILAGVTMNFIAAMAVLSFGFWYGLPQVIDEVTDLSRARDAQISILQVAPESPAEAAGIKIGDHVLGFTINGEDKTATEVTEVQEFINTHKGQEFNIAFQRGDEKITKTVTPRTVFPEGEGALGIALAKTAVVSYPVHIAIWNGVKSTFVLSGAFLFAIGGVIAHLFTDGKLVADIAGPIGIGSLVHQFTQLGFPYLIQLTAVLSINLAIINAFPFPALDGGRFLFLLIEAIKGSPLNQKFEKTANTAGFALLILLLILITVKDVMKLF